MKTKLPVFAITGGKNSGKTSMVVSIIEELTKRGYSIVSVKHTRGEYSVDRQGTDTWKHREAGAKSVVFSTPSETAFYIKSDMGLNEILETLPLIIGPDMVIVEGMKDEDLPGADVSHAKASQIIDQLVETIELYRVKKELAGLDCGMCGYKDCNAMAKAKYEGKDVHCTVESNVVLEIQGKRVPLGPFPSEMLKGGITGMLSSLKGVESLENVVIKLNSEE
ncbi:MAG: molybdopterin-guanine dinucleotide biosynthesis protein B [Thermoplasmata archaeon]